MRYHRTAVLLLAIGGDAMEYEGFTGFEEIIDSYDHVANTSRVIFSRHGTPLRISASTYVILHAQAHGVTLNDLAIQLNRAQTDRQITVHDLQALLDRLREDLKRYQHKRSDRLPWGFWLHVQLIPQSMVRWLAERLSFMFSRAMLLFVAAVSIYSALSLIRTPHSPIRDPAQVLLHAYFLFLVSAVIHEFGHATAAHRLGAKPREIGIAIYLIYLAFYSDVTSTWGLPAKKRAVVDLAGAYFQIVVGDVFMIAYQVTGDRCYLIAIGMILLSILMCLNPIFKFDGYWTLADIVDIGRLDKVPQKLTVYLWRTIRGLPRPPLPWRGGTLGLLVAYSLAYATVWGTFGIRMLPMSLSLLLNSISKANRLRISMRADDVSNWIALFSLLCTVVFLLSCARMCYQFALVAVRKLHLAIGRNDVKQGGTTDLDHPAVTSITPVSQAEALTYGTTSDK